ncbi:acyl carrier protein [Micromonospora sp. HM134]|uniref:acyl carrier protein n=1 Tax=unclassified Micromonospora TaxID=2617518 RepID=UPI00119859C4|nr:MULTISPECIES: acyl carrier protein [unclassified Micromonospora]QDY07958.1 acyl carrier protein [Micromonospora sp. HM134]
MSATTWPAPFEAILRRYLAAVSTDEDVPAEPLVDLGLDSLRATALLTELEKEFGVDFGDEVLDPALFSSAGHMWTVVQGLMGDSSSRAPQ